ncbi:MAG TPA: hypothetical protein ENG45_00185, partial [Candidatus Aenigmarchaeota archaeon]|nr:hypothetical protein [Candidatus Aenigmarchaeota archaeon]
MKLAIITTPDRVEQDKILARNAKKKFSDVIYTSIDNIKLKVGDEFGVYCNGDNLIDSDYTLLIPTLKYREFFYTTVRILENCRVPTSVVSEKFFIIWNRVLLLRTLAKEGIKVRKAFSIAQNVVLDKVLKELKLPVIITTTTGKRIYVNNEEALKDVLSLFEAGYMITFEKPITPESIIWSFVVGNEVVASYEKVEKKMRSIVLD